MRFFRLTAAAAGVMAIAACGGEKQASKDVETATPAATEATTGAVAFAPVTGTMHEVQMTLVNGEYKYVPEEITVKVGDGIKYINVSGGPHDVSFDPATLTPEVRAQLGANMLETVAELRGKLLVQANEEYAVSFGKIAPGVYTAICTPHALMNMTQKITVVE